MPTVWNEIRSSGEPLTGMRVEVFLYRGDVRTPAFVDDAQHTVAGPWYAVIDDTGRWELDLEANDAITSPVNTYYVAHEPQPLFDRPTVTSFRLAASPSEQWLGDIRIADAGAEPIPVVVLPGAAGLADLDVTGQVVVDSARVRVLDSVVLCTWASAGVGQLRVGALVEGDSFAVSSSAGATDAGRSFFWAVINP